MMDMNNFFLKKICTVTVFLLMAQILGFAQEIKPEVEATAQVIDPLEELTAIISTMPYSMDPHTGTYHTEAQIQSALYEGLFTYSPDAGEPQMALATSFRISRDRLRWTFTLRDNAKWSDGSPITANDVKESWLNLLATEGAPYSSMLDVISGAKEFRIGTGSRDAVAIYVIDDTTLTVRLTEPTAHLAHLLCHNSTAVVKEDLSIYSGAFVLESMSRDTVVLSKNENYWDKENVKLEKIKIVQVEDEKETSYMFNTGAADWIIENADVNTVLNKAAIQIGAEFATLYLFFKNKGGFFDNELFRSALLEAVPWEQVRSGFIIPALTLVYPIPGYQQPNGYSYTDAKEAEILMRLARDELGIAQDEKIKLTFAIGEGMEYMRNIAQQLTEAWSPLGIEVVPLTVRGDYFGSIMAIDADLFMYNWIGDYGDPMAFLDLFRGDSSLNLSGWKNEKFDALLSQAAHADSGERLKLLSAAEQLLIDSAEIIPISHMVAVNIIELNAVGGWATNALNVHPFKFMFKRKVKQTLPGTI